MRYTISLFLATLATPALAEVPRVVTDIPPVQSLVAQVMGDLGQPVLLLEKGANAHNVTLKPSQIAALTDAQLIVWVGPEMTPWLDRALDTNDGAPRLGLLEAPGTTLRDYGTADPHDAGEAGHDDHGADEEHHDHDHADAESEEHHHHSGHDPHAWLDPDNARAWLGAIAEALVTADPANAATYRANAGAADARIAALDATLKTRLAPLHDRPFVVFHDAYGYFADHYDLTIAGAISLGDAASPGAAHLKALQEGMQTGAPLCIFPEANHDPKLVTTMVEGTPVRTGGALDPEGSMLEPGAGLYDALMTGLADTLTACLLAPS